MKEMFWQPEKIDLLGFGEAITYTFTSLVLHPKFGREKSGAEACPAELDFNMAEADQVVRPMACPAAESSWIASGSKCIL